MIDRKTLSLHATTPTDLNTIGAQAEVYQRPIEGYVVLGGERIFVRVESHYRFVGPNRAYIVLAEAPPLYGSASYHGLKWRAELKLLIGAI